MHRKDGRKEVRVRIDGIRRTTGYTHTVEEARRMLTAAVHDRDTGVPFIAGSPTLGEFAAQWLADRKPDLKETTYLRYENLLRVHILPTLGKTPTKKLTPAPVQQVLNARRGAPVSGKHNQTVSATTVRRAHAVLHTLLEQARRLGHVVVNVCDNVQPPRAEPRQTDTFSREQVYAYLDAIRGDRLESLYVLELATGVRQGELLGLHWRDVDFSIGRLHVRATLYRRKGGEFVFTPPKTRGSMRIVPLGLAAIEALPAHRVRQAQERLRLGELWHDNDLVFPAEDGSPMDAQALRWRYRRARARAGLPSSVRFHDLRHTYATLLRELGMDIKGVSAALGHSTTAITADLYTHVTAAMYQQLADASDAIMLRPSLSEPGDGDTVNPQPA
jgi:integrase